LQVLCFNFKILVIIDSKLHIIVNIGCIIILDQLNLYSHAVDYLSFLLNLSNHRSTFSYHFRDLVVLYISKFF